MNSKRQANIFYFKKFSVHHDRASLKVGTDAVLLGAWTTIDGARRILDVGTGSGVIALMLAQRASEETLIDAVEIEETDVFQARDNVSMSPWGNKILIHHQAIQQFQAPYKYDLIVSNPPFFVDSLLPPSTTRAQAKHTPTLSFEELIEHSVRLLNSAGRLVLILPFAEGNKFKSAAGSKLFLLRETAFFSRKEKPQERWLLEFGLTQKPTQRDELVLYETGTRKSQAYINLTKDFYL